MVRLPVMRDGGPQRSDAILGVFNGGDAFHKDSVTVRSHGCVHLTHCAAQNFYSTLRVGDVVQIVG